MSNRTSWLRLIPMAIVVCALIGSQRVESQCVVTTTNVTYPGPMTILVEKYLATDYFCASIPTQMNAVDCNPGAGGSSTSLLSAEAMTATVMPACAWNCTGCPGPAPHATIDSSDGLPVELMDFAIEDDVATAGRDEGVEESDRRASR